MSKIVVLGFDDEAAADAFGKKLEGMHAEAVLRVDDAVKVTVDADGKVKLHHEFSMVRGGAAVGGVLGLVVGTLFLNPIAGAAIGAAGGAAIGRMSGDYGIDDDFIKKTSEALAPGSAALFLMVNAVDADKVRAEIEGTKATVISTTLTSEAEDALRAALSDSPPSE